MSHTDRRGAALLLAVLVPLLATGLLEAQAPAHRLGGKILLRHHPPTGERHQFLQEEEVHVRADSGSAVDVLEQRFRSAIYSMREVTGPVGPHVAVTMRVDSAFAEAVLPTGEVRREPMLQLQGMVGGLVYDDRFRLVRAEFVDASGVASELTRSLTENVKSSAIGAFPARAVGVGDSWEESLSLPMALPGVNHQLTASVRMTLLDVRLSEGDTTAVIGLGCRMPDQPIAVTQGDGRFHMKLRGEWTGELLYSLARGAALQLDFGGSLRVEVAGGVPATPAYAMRMDQRLVHRVLAAAGGP